MVGAATKSRRKVRFRSSILVFTALALPLLVQPACGSDDGKKKAGPGFMHGGEGGELSSGGSSPVEEGGSSGSGGSPGSAGAAAGTGEGGSGGSTVAGAGGSTVAGAGGEAGGGSDGPDCPTGTADCDDDPTTCETDVTQLDECGACGVMCEQTNGTVICGDSGCEVTSCMADYGDCNDTGTDGCEASLTTADNCGFCDRDCGSQACTNKLCDPVQLGSAQSAYRWARTADALYRIDGNTPNYGLASNYVLTRTPLDGGAEVVMHSDAKNPGGLAVDDSSVYWAVNGTPAAVLKKAHDAAAVTTPTPVFETPSIPVQLRIQDNYMYWTNLAGAIYRRAMNAPLSDDGDEIVTAAQVAGTGTFNLHQDFVVTPTAMYWVVLPTSGNLAFIRTAPLAGGNATDVASAITNSFFKLSLLGEDLYWIRATGSALDGAYHYAPGEAVEALVLQAGLNAVHATADYLYLLGGSNTVYRAPGAGGTSIKIGDSSGLAYAMDFAGHDGANVYVLTSFTHGAGFFGDYKLLGYPL
jgi:hypothetical protein